MFKIIKILLLLSFLSIFTYLVYPIIKTRYFNHPTVPTEPSLESKMNNINNASDDSASSPSLNDNLSANSSESSPILENSLSGKNTDPVDPTATINLNERGTKDSENLAHITTEHCDNNCDAFATDFKFLEYCQQVCGLVPVKETSDCDDQKDIQKDYCLKDLAITKKDSKLCDPIQDANIKLTCQNRILEDALDSQPAPPAKLDF